MKKLAILAGFFTLAASAGEPRQCPNPDVLNALVFRVNPGMQSHWTRILPAQLSGFRAPAVFNLIGTAVRENGFLTVVAYKTDLPKDLAYDLMLAALGKEWEEERAPIPFLATVAPSIRQSGTLCRNGRRRDVMVEDLGEVRYASITLVDDREQRDCKAPLPRYVPRLEFLDGTSVVGGQGVSGTSYFGRAGSSTRVSSSVSAAVLAQALGAQLIAQGWRRDAGWNGKASVGSTWRKNDGGASLQATLEVTGTGEGIYNVDLSVVRPE